MIINMQSGGVVPERILDAQTITPSTVNQAIEEGTYLRGALTILGDADLIPENIPSDVNLFGIQGIRPPNYGANVWAKYYYEPPIEVTNPQFYGTVADSVIAISSENFDVGLIEDWITFFNGFKATDDATYKFVKTSGDLYYNNLQGYPSSTVQTKVNSFDKQTKQFTLYSGVAYINHTFKYTGTKVFKDAVKNLLNYVVDDNPNAYPNGAIHTDGYYYELLGQVSSANVMSLSDTALITVQQDYRDTIETEVCNDNA